MRKFAYTVFAALSFALAALADVSESAEPDFVVRTRSPKIFFVKAVELFRKIYPDPQLEMRASFALMPFGYPNFNGVSQKENTVICGFDIDSQNPVYVIGMKVDDDALINKTLTLQKLKTYKKGDFTFLPLNLGEKNPSPYVDSAHNAVLDKTRSFMEVEMNAKALRHFGKGKFSDMANDVEKAVARFDDDGEKLFLAATIILKKNSPVYKIVNSVRRQKIAKEAQFIPQDAELTIISKIKSPQESDALQAAAVKNIFPADFARKYEALSKKNDGTFAVAVNFGSRPQMTGVGATSLTSADIVNFAAENAKMEIKLASETVLVENSIFKLSDVECVETSFSNLPEEKTFACIVNGLSVTSSNREIFADTISKIKNSQTESPYPLRKYAADDSDLIAVVNNKSVLQMLLSKLGAKIRDDIDIGNSVISADIALGKIEIFAAINIRSLNYYSDFYRTLNRKNGSGK